MLYLGNQKVVPVIQTPSVKREIVNGVFKMPTSGVDFVLPDNATDIGDYALYYAMYYATGINKFSTNKVTQITGGHALDNAFRGSSITEADLSNITTVTGADALFDAFYDCDDLTKIDLRSLTAINTRIQNIAYGCDGLTEFNLSNLESINVSNGCNSMCYRCTSLREITFPKLSSIAVSYAFQYAFSYCKNLHVYFPALTTNSFGSYTNQFSSFFGSGTDNTVHFPSNLESTLTSWSFSGTRTTKLFDLPATE